MTAVTPSFCDEARLASDAAWRGLLGHPFVHAMARGTLPPERFRFYITQNLIYLPEYTRALAIGVAKTTDDATMQRFVDAVQNIADVEIPTNERLRARIDTFCTRLPGAHDAEAAPATVAYASWLLATAYQGQAVDVLTAIMPCAWSYGDIARSRRDEVVEHPVYSDWIAFFASDEYAKVVVGLRAALEAATTQSSPAERSRLIGVFRTACRMEHRFWDMGWSGEQWADLAGGDS
jgi:thiaminase (transcriptional activator TenA)